jgi:hypothetical protein
VIPNHAESTAPWIAAPPDPRTAADLVVRRFEFTSRGDRVPGILFTPSTPGPFPLVLVQHGASGSKDADYLDAVRLPWVRRGAAVASIDFPLHGERVSAKLTEQILGYLAAPADAGPNAGALFAEFARQSVSDVARTIDAVATLPDIDASRVAYVGFSMGAILGSLAVPYDERIRAAVLAVGGAGFGPPPLDPTAHVGRFAPRPLLFVNATRDERIPRSAAEAFHAAAGEPKEMLWFDAGHADLPGAALKAMWRFLATHLRVA